MGFGELDQLIPRETIRPPLSRVNLELPWPRLCRECGSSYVLLTALFARKAFFDITYFPVTLKLLSQS